MLILSTLNKEVLYNMTITRNYDGGGHPKSQVVHIAERRWRT